MIELAQVKIKWVEGRCGPRPEVLVSTDDGTTWKALPTRTAAVRSTVTDGSTVEITLPLVSEGRGHGVMPEMALTEEPSIA